MKNKMSGARFIAETLKGYGITHVFFMEAVLRQTLVEMETLGISRVLAHSEKAAAYMADGYARTRRSASLCMSQSVGAANLAAGLQDAYLGLSPVIAITGRRPPIALYRHAYQEIDHIPLFQAVTKFHASVETVDQLPFLLRQAFREATSGAPGPVHLDITDHIGRILEKAEVEMEVIAEKPFAHYPSSRPLPEDELIQDAVDLIQKATRPVIVAGGGVITSEAGAEVVEMAEKLSIPVATSLNGKGAILENHPLSLGVVGTYSRWCAN
jgi:acetolactate synthase-1/2/3 large subunit